MRRQFGAIVMCSMVLVGCQNMPNYSWPTTQRPKTVINKPKPIVKAVTTPVIQPTKPVVKEPEVAKETVSAPTESPSIPSSPLILKPVAAPNAGKKLADGRDSAAVQGLLASASDSLQQGNLESAAISLERAQRLAPQSATVYLQLAQVRMQQGRAIEAEQLARKGLSYAQSNGLQAALWRLVAEAAEQQGKFDSALSAKNKAMQLEMAGDRG